MHRGLKLRHAFPNSADEYTRPMERLLQIRRAEMDEAWANIEEGWAANTERMARFGLTARPADKGVVELNVGGSHVTVSWPLLSATDGFEGSILFALLEGVWGKEHIPRDADGFIVLDESPTCIKYIINAVMTGRASSGATGMPESGAGSAVAVDEAPCHIYTAYVMGLPGSMPMHSNYVKVNGGSSIMEPFEIAPFSAKIRQWVGGPTEQMTLLYRATRDGFGREAFRAKCNQRSGNTRTISLIRVSPGEGNDDDDDSVVGGYSVLPWGKAVGSWHTISEAMFVFMLKDGSANRADVSMPKKMGACFRGVIAVPSIDGPYFGESDLVTKFDKTSEICTIQTGKRHFRTVFCPPFLALNGKQVVDIEVYRYSTPAAPTSAAPSITKPSDDALTDAEAPEIHSFGQSIANSLVEERVVLGRAEKEMEAASARVSAAIGALENVYGPSVAAGEQDAVVELNVRGVRMTTLRSTLQACPRSALATMFDAERWPATDKDKDEQGRRLMDCNPTCFSKILDVLRMRKRASWSRGATPEKQEGSSGNCPGAIFIKQVDMKAFRNAVQMYFPGCESFIMGLCSVHSTPAAW